MLRIQDDQLRALGGASLEGFEDRMIAHAREHFPAHTHFLGEARLRTLIHDAIRRARGHRITKEHGVRIYLSLMLLFGSAFDADPQLPWAAALLADRALHEVPRASRLWDAAMEYRDRVAGPEGEHLARALLHLAFEPPPLVEHTRDRDREEALVDLVRRAYPTKYEDLGDDRAREHVRRGLAAARDRSIRTERGLATYVLSTLVLGSAFDADPQFFWAAEALASPGAADPGEALHDAALTRLDQWLAFLQETGGR